MRSVELARYCICAQCIFSYAVVKEARKFLQTHAFSTLCPRLSYTWTYELRACDTREFRAYKTPEEWTKCRIGTYKLNCEYLWYRLPLIHQPSCRIPRHSMGTRKGKSKIQTVYRIHQLYNTNLIGSFTYLFVCLYLSLLKLRLNVGACGPSG